MLATSKRHRLIRPALLLALVLALTAVAGLTQPVHADSTQDCLDACDASLAWCESTCPPTGHGRFPCLAACRSGYSYCLSTCSP
ncbi:MAG TPA: hypothetical protein VF173_26135 [Thermoanaerobaculia bacterium]|nr:hypothetical protein [Thermoanaerobaculia bacterium]